MGWQNVQCYYNGSFFSSQSTTCDDESHPWKQVIASITQSSLKCALTSDWDIRATVACPQWSVSLSCVELCPINFVLPLISLADLCVSLKGFSAAHEVSGFVSIFPSLLSLFLISRTLVWAEKTESLIRKYLLVSVKVLPLPRVPTRSWMSYLVCLRHVSCHWKEMMKSTPLPQGNSKSQKGQVI